MVLLLITVAGKSDVLAEGAVDGYPSETCGKDEATDSNMQV